MAIFIIPTFAPDGFTDFTMTVEDSVSRVGVGIVKIAFPGHFHYSDIRYPSSGSQAA